VSSPTIPRYDEIEAWLGGFTNYERQSDYRHSPDALGTERVAELLARLGEPHLRAPVLHIAGTKGKGSVACLTARLLQEKGCRVGLFTSPHVLHLRERIRIGGRPVTPERFAEVFARVRPVAEAMREHPVFRPPTYFEILTAAAFVAFAEAECDVVVLEVGLGGRLDATNLPDLPAVATAITPVSRDHMKQLGGELHQIAGEKAGILRPEVPLVLAPQERTVRALLLRRAEAIGVPVLQVGRDIRVRHHRPPPADDPQAPQRLSFETWRGTEHRDVPLPLAGAHQLPNAAVALGLAELFLEEDARPPLGTSALRRAWRHAELPGRIELVSRAPWVVLDGAHNAASAWALAEVIHSRFPPGRRALVFGAQGDKEIEVMLRILAPLFDLLILTSTGSPRSMDARAVQAHIRESHLRPARVIPDPAEALEEAVVRIGPEGMACVAGSLYLAGLLRGHYRDGPA
jgi:dihydrofolate synthase/folylpolyglutamate synthase